MIIIISSNISTHAQEDGWYIQEPPMYPFNTYRIEYGDSNHAMVGSLFGELLKTTDGGNSWLEVPSVRQMWFGILNIQYISDSTWIISGRPGIQRTDDFGKTWRDILNIDSGDIFVESSSFIDSEVGVYSDSQGRLRYTTTGGDSWISLNPDTNINNYWYRVSISPSGNICTFDYKSIIYTSADFGATWNLYADTLGALQGIFFANDSTIIASGITENDYGYVIRCTDDGVNWNVVYTWPFGGPIGDLDFKGSVGYIVGGSGLILRSDNSGLTWYKQEAPPGEYFDISVLDSKIASAVGYNLLIKTVTGGMITDVKNDDKALETDPPKIYLFPTPSNSQLFVSSSNRNFILKLQLFSETGILVDEFSTPHIPSVLDTSMYPSGMYILTIITNSDTQHHSVVIAH